MLIQNEKLLLSQLLDEQERDDSFKQECRTQEIEWNLTKNLKEYRIRLNLSQKEVAEKCGLTRQMVSRIETYTYSPTLTTFVKYLLALNIDISKIINEFVSEKVKTIS